MSELRNALDLHSRCKEAARRATSSPTRCPGCQYVTLHFTRGAEISYSCGTSDCPTRGLRARAVKALGGR